jgi:hypothetical protein
MNLRPFALFLFLPVIAFTQTASITGLVTDPTRTAIPNAAVAVKNTDTGVARKIVTNAEGYYTVPLLPQGRYSIDVEAAGFQSFQKSGFHLDEGQVLRADFNLQVGASSQRMQVVETARLSKQKLLRRAPLSANSPLSICRSMAAIPLR